ncbi:hypothetical protein V5799_027333 [Amblyomma americanum]|uniref:Secreted protein n=1 Tax=Amblyomma americanum TaxID=6943 RepID=A0AAQ4DG08_AMBAM
MNSWFSPPVFLFFFLFRGSPQREERRVVCAICRLRMWVLCSGGLSFTPLNRQYVHPIAVAPLIRWRGGSGFAYGVGRRDDVRIAGATVSGWTATWPTWWSTPERRPHATRLPVRQHSHAAAGHKQHGV